jgi:hypothetical protein
MKVFDVKGVINDVRSTIILADHNIRLKYNLVSYSKLAVRYTLLFPIISNS